MALDNGKSKSFKSWAFILITAVVVVLSAMALIVSISITSTMIRKQDQLTGSRPDSAESLKRNNSGLTGVMNLKKAVRQPLFFSGKPQEGLVYYASDSGRSLLPVDIILDKLKANYGILNSDDAFNAVVNGKELLLGLGTRSARVGGSIIELDTASMAAENHVLASPGILDSLDGISFYSDVANEAAFANYWPSSNDEKYSGIGLFKIDGRTLEISDIFGSRFYSYGADSPAAMDEAVYSGSLGSLLVKSGEEYYSINKKNYKKPSRLDLKGSYSLSSDGGFLYRVDDSGKYFLIYDLKSSSLKKLKNHYSSVRLKSGVSLTDCRLLAQQAGREFARLDFEGPGGDVYTVIARSGRIVAQGSSKYSPDHARLLLYSKSDGWILCSSDGRGIVHLKDAATANWVDNDRILLRTDKGLEVYERKDGGRHAVEVPFYYLGKADDGTLFFAKGNELYQIIKGKEKEIAVLPWKCDYACSAGSKSPVVMISKQADTISGILGDETIPLGKPGLFPNIPAADAEDAGFNSNAAFSPDRGRLALLQKGEKFLEVNLLGLKDMRQDKLTLDYVPGLGQGNTAVFMKWLGDDSLMVYIDNRGWLVNFDKDDTYIHEWTDNASIAGTFQLLP